MKYLYIFSILLSFYASSNPMNELEEIEWLEELEHDFGDIIQNEAATISFHYKNNSSQPLVVETVRSQCGCTVPDWSYEALAPNDTGKINIIYDAKRTGYFRKKVKVYFKNYKKPAVLFVAGFVEPTK